MENKKSQRNEHVDDVMYFKQEYIIVKETLNKLGRICICGNKQE
jgi:hypothetical protein